MIDTLRFMTMMVLEKGKRDDRGATAVEYGLMVALIAIIIIAGVSLLGSNLNALFSDIASKL